MAVLGVLHEAVLQREGDRRQAEQQAAVHPAHVAGRAAPRRHQEDGDEQQEVGDQEGFAAGEMLGPVFEHAPGAADHEGADKADEVQRPPGSHPRDRGDAEVEHEIIAEQRDMIAAAGRHQ
jgi:hypothetical protein